MKRRSTIKRVCLSSAIAAAIAAVACSGTEPGSLPAQQRSPAPIEDAGEAAAEAAPGPEDAPTVDDDIVVGVREEPYEIFVDIRLREQERPALDFRAKSRNLRISWDRARSQQDQVGDLSRLLERLFADHGGQDAPTSLTIALDIFGYPDLVERLARYASSDPAWTKRNKSAGEPGIKALHDYIEEATRSAKLHPELDEAFAAVGRRVELVDVEKCSTARPGGADELGGFLAARGVPGKVKLPAGCLMSTFRIEPQ